MELELSVDGKPTAMKLTPVEAVKKMREDAGYSNLFKANVISGLGKDTGGTPGTHGTVDIKNMPINRLDEQRDREIMGSAWEVGFAHDMVISTVTFSQAEFSAGPIAVSPIVTSILHDGIAV